MLPPSHTSTTAHKTSREREAAVATLAGMSWSKKTGLLGVLLLAQQAKAAARACNSAQAAPSSRLLARTRTCRA